MTEAQILELCTIRDTMGTKAPYVETKLVRRYSESLYLKLVAENEAYRASRFGAPDFGSFGS